MFVILDKYLNCAADKTIDTGHTASTNCNTNYGIILLMLLITSWCKPLKTDPSREICTYATWVTHLQNKHPDKLICVCYCST